MGEQNRMPMLSHNLLVYRFGGGNDRRRRRRRERRRRRMRRSRGRRRRKWGRSGRGRKGGSEEGKKREKNKNKNGKTDRWTNGHHSFICHGRNNPFGHLIILLRLREFSIYMKIPCKPLHNVVDRETMLILDSCRETMLILDSTTCTIFDTILFR